MYYYYLFYENVQLNVSYDFKMFDGFEKKQGVMFLMVPSKDRIALQTLILNPKEYKILFENTFN
jgi:hypothetical protein